jgi:uncharacterized protein YndB with AHSA1/START domain
MTRFDTTAPVASTRQIEVDAAPAAVYDVLTQVEAWPRWNPDVKTVAIDGDFAEGATFRWKAGGTRLVSQVRDAEPGRIAAWSGRTMGIKAVHVYRFEPRGDRTLVTTEESFDGLVARVLRRPLQKALDSALEGGLEHLKREAERTA